jgi:lipoprotein-releasing system ATP-binding protein
MSLVELKNLTKSYPGDKPVLENLNLQLRVGERVALLGESGSGKSTLLQVCGLLDNATGGEIIIDGISCNFLSDNEKTRIRREKIGFVYQFHHLLSEFNLLDNLVIPQIVAGEKESTAKDKALNLLSKVALMHKKNSLPHEISGGEKQRIAILRSIINDPKIILADEPTGNLDHDNAKQAFSLLESLALEGDSTLILATHSHDIASLCSRIITIEGGKIL